KGKNWNTLKYKSDTRKYVAYEGAQTLKVTLTKEGEGTLTATGAADLNAVLEGTVLTIEATPADGYKLTTLTANGTDILATKKFVVKGATEVKATFTKMAFTVTLTKEGEGTLTATGADDLTAVPDGTELTIGATPAEGYELTALTANGTDILATKKFVVKEATEVKATFTKMAFAVTLTKEGEGTLTATGADDLDAVPRGTELTIVATPAEGYELTALTANGTDILASKKVVVTSDLTIKATFAKKSFAVSLTKEGEGTLTATGADDLTAVPYGTELTIAATPAEGYELTALTANGEDILATKKFVVKGATEVKATFTKMAFAVTLTSNEHGTISIAEEVNLKAVPYGTTLTVQATGKNAQCVLTELTANGKDILATKKFVVKGATEVKATFVDHTGVETTVTQQVKLYPNPATDYVIVEGIAPASEVMLHSMTGELLCAMQADAEGHLQIDLTALSDGVYLLVGTGWQERLVVKK
ncbi:T9SS type A sorting domain-containing protein, partial [uncultured Porphyromonas sp.]|uniref:InlB B-repeat-containing protein n=1 Tax=uncultured Porphyromonas sp. TaxID=159274 RepID=UPI002622DFD6